MPTLDLGALVGTVRLDTRQWESTYTRVVRQMAELGAQAERAGARTIPLDRGLGGVGEASVAAAAAVTRANAALVEAGVASGDAAVATKALSDVTTEAGLASSRLTQAQLRQGAAQLRLAELESSATASTRQLLMAQAQLTAATDRVTLAEERAGKTTGLTSQLWQKAGHTMLVTGGVIAAGFAYAAKSAANFDSRMALVRTLAKASSRDMASLREAALTAGTAYGFTANQVADAEAELVKAGVSVKDILGGALRGALTLAAAGQEDVAAATETATIAMTQFGLKGRDVPHVADLLAAGADKALGSVGDLSQALRYGGLAASQAKFSIEQTVGTLAELAQAGQIGSRAGQGLQMMLRNLEHPSVDAAGVMKQYGISVYDASGRMRDITQIAGQLHDKLGGLTDEQQKAALATLFNANAVRVATILMRDGATVNAQWIQTVNDQGFAALQASGKLNSLSGDATKLKAALQAAFIGVGEGSSGPLRTLTQDVTQAVNAWNALPGPVKTGAEALIAIVGAAALTGGAFLVLLPKIAATRAAMTELGISGSRAAGILGKGGILFAALTAAVAAVGSVDNAMHHTSINADAMTASLENLAKTGQITGELTRAFGSDLSNLKNTLHLAGSGVSVFGLHFHSLSDTFTHTGGAFSDARNRLSSVDEALTSLVTSGHADLAARAFSNIAEAAKAQGISVADLAAKFPQYSGALRASGDSAKEAGTGVDQYGNAVTAAAQATNKAADAAKSYSDRLHSLADPLFAMNSALVALTASQHAASKAVAKYGADSKQAKQAQQDLASKSLDVETSAKSLTAAVKDGSVSLDHARKMLRGWVADGILAKSQAKEIAATWQGLIDKAGKLAATGRKGGHAVGFDFGQGMAIGLADSTGAVDAQAAKLAMSAAAAARRAHQSKSPSKVAEKITLDFGAGMVKGLKGSEAQVADAAARLAKRAVDAAKSAVQDARSQLSTDLSSRQSTVSGITSGLLGSLDLSNAVVNGRVGNISGFLNAGLVPLRREHHDEALLRKSGLDPELLAQIAGTDPNTGLELAQNILSGRSGSIEHLDVLERQARHYAKATGRLVGHAQFDDRIASDRQDVHDSLIELRGIRAALQSVNKTLKDNPHMTGREVGDAIDQAFRGASHKAHARTSR